MTASTACALSELEPALLAVSEVCLLQGTGDRRALPARYGSLDIVDNRGEH